MADFIHTSQWRPLSPSDFLRRFALPQMARVASPVQGPAGLDLSQPFLLYRAYASRKVHARSLDRDPGGGTRTVGPQIVVPESYQGWFALVSPDGHTAGSFVTIGQVAEAQIPLFLVKDDVSGYRLQERRAADGKGVYVKTKVRSGQLLRFLGAYEDTSSSPSKCPPSGNGRPPLPPPVADRGFSASTPDRTSSSSRRRPHTCQFAKCLDEAGESIFLPFPAEGRFYAVAPNTRSTIPSVGHVFSASQLARVGPSAVVRLVSGPRPRLPCHFTSVLRLEEVRQSEVIVACAFRAGCDPVLLEIDVASCFGLVPLVSPDVRTSTPYQRLLQICVTQAERWRAQIKIAQPVLPPMPPHALASKSFFGSRKHPALQQTPQPQAAYIAVRCDANDGSLASRSSLKSKKSSLSSASVGSILSRLFVRSKKFRMRETENPGGDKRPSPSPTAPLAPPPEDHFYETILEDKKKSKKQQQQHWEPFWGEDGYVVTSHANTSNALEPVYDSVC